MIKKLDSGNEETCRRIRSLFQASYKVEAELLKAHNFPPLKRELKDFLTSKTEFYALFRDNKIAAIAEVKSENDNTDIESLVVHPNYFRQGLGRQLMQFILRTYDFKTFTVETGSDNEPACCLYKQLGFQEQKHWETDFGIRKVKFIKTQQTSI